MFALSKKIDFFKTYLTPMLSLLGDRNVNYAIIGPPPTPSLIKWELKIFWWYPESEVWTSPLQTSTSLFCFATFLRARWPTHQVMALGMRGEKISAGAVWEGFALLHKIDVLCFLFFLSSWLS